MLEKLDLNKKLSKSAYARQMSELQERLRGLQYAVRDANLAVIICLEGWDTSGKGEVIKKLTERLDPRLFRVHQGAPPTPLEQRYHFLWRYQTRLPAYGEMGMFDHSWYGRVLVERCHKLVPKKVWRQGYEQINEFERWLGDDGQVLIKFWLHISKKEQKKRFKRMLADRLQSWRITKDYRRQHRSYAKWTEAVEEMLAKTGTPYAQWSLIEANDVRWARVRVFDVIARRIEDALNKRGAKPKLVASKPEAAHA